MKVDQFSDTGRVITPFTDVCKLIEKIWRKPSNIPLTSKRKATHKNVRKYLIFVLVYHGTEELIKKHSDGLVDPFDFDSVLLTTRRKSTKLQQIIPVNITSREIRGERGKLSQF